MAVLQFAGTFYYFCYPLIFDLWHDRKTSKCKSIKHIQIPFMKINVWNTPVCWLYKKVMIQFNSEHNCRDSSHLIKTPSQKACLSSEVSLIQSTSPGITFIQCITAYKPLFEESQSRVVLAHLLNASVSVINQ